MILIGSPYFCATESPTGALLNAVTQSTKWGVKTPMTADLSSEWYVTWGGTSDDYAMRCALDNSGYNIYFTGRLGTNGGDAFLAKFSIGGTQVWNRTWGGALAEDSYSVIVDSSDNVFVAGYTQSFPISAEYDAHLRKYDSSGNLLWNRTWGKLYNDIFCDVDVDTSGNIYCGTYYTVTGGNSDLALVKYDPSGNQLWNRTYGSLANEGGGGVKVDLYNDIYLFGDYNNDAVVLKYNSSGDLLWARTWGGSGQDLQSVGSVDSQGYVYMAGRTNSFGLYWDVFLVKYDSNGTKLWDRTWGGSQQDTPNDLQIDAADNIYISGHEGSFSAGAEDNFVLKYDSAGNKLGEITWGGTANEKSGYMCLDENNNIYLSGGTASWGAGGTDAYLAFILNSSLKEGGIPGDYFILWIVIPAIIAVVLVSLYAWQRNKRTGVVRVREKYPKYTTPGLPPRITPQTHHVDESASSRFVPAPTTSPAVRVTAPVAPVSWDFKVIIQRQFEYVGGKVRVKAKVRNATPQGILRVRVALDVPSSFHLLRIEPNEYDHEGPTVKLNDLLPKEEKAVAWVLEPLICGTESIGGTTSGVDANGTPFAIPMAPLEIQVRCPLFARPEEVNLPTVQRMIGDLAVKSERVFYLPPGLTPSDALELAKAVISARDVHFVGTFASSQAEGAFEESAWFYGTTKVGQKRYILTASVSEKDRAIRIFTACDDEAGCTGFLAEAGAAIRRELVQRGAVDSEEKVKELVCEKCGGNLPRAPTIGQDIQCPDCRWIWRVTDFFR